ncbi:MAG: succinate dehydrogenase cytochrome b subunit [Deltaproteobacteria bacterium]|nr:succinate dehydrogenase cytochrome b subunit [Deltaproteobacteria bacterium]
MALSGVMLSLFLFAHGAGNAVAFLGSEALNSYAAKLHSLSFAVIFFECVLLAAFVLHILLGMSLFLENSQARPVRYQVERSSAQRTPGSRTMPYSGVVILIFIAVHLVNFHFTDRSIPAAELVRKVLRQPFYVFFHISAMAVLALHISHGFWSLFQSLGLSHPKYDAALKNSTLGLALLLSALFIVIPLCTLFIDEFLL